MMHIDYCNSSSSFHSPSMLALFDFCQFALAHCILHISFQIENFCCFFFWREIKRDEVMLINFFFTNNFKRMIIIMLSELLDTQKKKQKETES